MDRHRIAATKPGRNDTMTKCDGYDGLEAIPPFFCNAYIKKISGKGPQLVTPVTRHGESEKNTSEGVDRGQPTESWRDERDGSWDATGTAWDKGCEPRN
jgi:hypothetical protein